MTDTAAPPPEATAALPEAGADDAPRSARELILVALLDADGPMSIGRRDGGCWRQRHEYCGSGVALPDRARTTKPSPGAWRRRWRSPCSAPSWFETRQTLSPMHSVQPGSATIQGLSCEAMDAKIDINSLIGRAMPHQ
jgi:hypothetical protein